MIMIKDVELRKGDWLHVKHFGYDPDSDVLGKGPSRGVYKKHGVERWFPIGTLSENAAAIQAIQADDLLKIIKVIAAIGFRVPDDVWRVAGSRSHLLSQLADAIGSRNKHALVDEIEQHLMSNGIISKRKQR